MPTASRIGLNDIDHNKDNYDYTKEEERIGSDAGVNIGSMMSMGSMGDILTDSPQKQRRKKKRERKERSRRREEDRMHTPSTGRGTVPEMIEVCHPETSKY